jgi:hypothetical protein
VGQIPWLHIVETGSRKCLNVANESKKPGAAIHLYKCQNLGHSNDQWAIQDSGNGLSFQFRNRNSGLCLASPSAGELTDMIQLDCTSLTGYTLFTLDHN